MCWTPLTRSWLSSTLGSSSARRVRGFGGRRAACIGDGSVALAARHLSTLPAACDPPLLQIGVNLGAPGYIDTIAKQTADIDVQARARAPAVRLVLRRCRTCRAAGARCSAGQGWRGAAGVPLQCLCPCPYACGMQVVFCNAGYVLTGFFVDVCVGRGAGLRTLRPPPCDDPAAWRSGLLVVVLPRPPAHLPSPTPIGATCLPCAPPAAPWISTWLIWSATLCQQCRCAGPAPLLVRRAPDIRSAHCGGVCTTPDADAVPCLPAPPAWRR